MLKKKIACLLAAVFTVSCSATLFVPDDDRKPENYEFPRLRHWYKKVHVIQPGSLGWRHLDVCRHMINNECVKLHQDPIKLQYVEVGAGCDSAVDFLAYGEGHIFWRRHVEPGHKVENVEREIPYDRSFHAALYAGMSDRDNVKYRPGCYVVWAGY